MKKITLLLFCVAMLASCGPKRMSCYGKRCVETTKAIPVHSDRLT